MKTFLFIILAIAITIWYFSAMKKIDREEAEALKTPGDAIFLRKAFSGFIDKVLSDQDNYIAFEQSDLIRFSKKSSPNKELIIQNFRGWGCAMMSVVVLENNKVIAEKEFKEGTSSAEIYNIILPLFT